MANWASVSYFRKFCLPLLLAVGIVAILPVTTFGMCSRNHSDQAQIDSGFYLQHHLRTTPAHTFVFDAGQIRLALILGHKPCDGTNCRCPEPNQFDWKVASNTSRRLVVVEHLLSNRTIDYVSFGLERRIELVDFMGSKRIPVDLLRPPIAA
jgi:hypothetical protein